jgi:hypothetical protein
MPGASAADQAPETKIGLLVVNEAIVPSDVLTLAKAETTRIYHALGVTFAWTETDDSGGGRGFVVKIIPRALKGKGIARGAMGVAPGTVESRGTVAYAFYDRIQDVTRSIGASPGLILGHVIAHEMGHLLLPYDAHARSGLMRGAWDTDQAMRATRGALTFTAREAALIRQRLRNIDRREPAPVVMTVLSLNNAGVSNTVLRGAQAEAAQIYATAGVTIVWTEPAGIARPASVSRLSMVILMDATVGHLARSPKVMGTTPFTSGGPGRTTYVFYERIETFAQTYRIDVSTFLGCVMAHEMGHLLLDRGAHSSAGLMRGKWEQWELNRARAGRLHFTKQEAAEIRRSAARTP